MKKKLEDIEKDTLLQPSEGSLKIYHWSILQQGDLDQIMEIIYLSQSGLETPFALDWSLSMIQSLLESSPSMSYRSLGLFKAKEFSATHELISFCFYMDLGESAEILLLATHPKYQGQGYMGQLLGRVKDNFKEIWLEVHEKNSNALKFYDKNNFKVTGRRKCYYKDKSDGILMTWKRELAF